MTQTFTLLLIALAGAAGPNTISGTVTSMDGMPIPTARVFLEPGLGGDLLEAPLTANGRFSFDNVPMGPVGIFAAAPGHGYAGHHENVTLAGELPAVQLVLPPADTLGGKVTDSKGDPVQGARIARIAVMGEHPVAIPLAKLQEFGFPEPVSGSDGRFRIPMLPKGGTVNLKVGHGSYAMEGVSNAKVGDDNFRVTLYRGVFIQGDVLSRDKRLPVANATILITNTQPPRDTSVARTDARGVFSARLKPGVYSYSASGAGLRSSGGEPLVVTGDDSQPKARLFVAGSGFVRGEVRDAIGGGPVSDAKIHLYNHGNLAAITRTGATGEYRFEAMEGENIVQVELAPGFVPPKDQRVLAMVNQGEECEVATLWLAPIPGFSVEIIGADGAPVPGAVVSLIQPRQFGFHLTGADGRATLSLAQAPSPGGVLGIVEDPAQPRGAVFRIPQQPDGPARVQLFPHATVRGTIVSSRGRELEGALVSGVLSTGEDEALLLWRTLSGPDGSFNWPGTVPGVPQYCAAWDDEGAEGASAAFNIGPGESKDLGRIVVQDAKGGKSHLGEKRTWRTLTHIAGPPPADTPHPRGTVLLYCTADTASAVVESLDKLRGILGGEAPECVVVVDGNFNRADAPLTIHSGAAPGRATAYILDSEDRVRMECFGLPPLFALRETKVP